MTDPADDLVAHDEALDLYRDTMLSFIHFQRDARRSSLAVKVEPDPLGDVNRIVRLVRLGSHFTNGDVFVKAVVAPVSAGADVQLVRDEGGYRYRSLFGEFDGDDAERPAWAPGWHVEVDGRTVLTVSDAEIWPPPTPPTIPARVRITKVVRQAINRRARAIGDAIAHRFGYRHEDEIGDDW